MVARKATVGRSQWHPCCSLSGVRTISSWAIAWIVGAGLAAGPPDAVSGVHFRFEPRPPGSLHDVTRFSAAQRALLEKLNRTDLGHLARVEYLVIPDTWELDERAYGPFPTDYPPARDHPQLLLVHVPGQAFAAYESGQLVRWGPVSTGAPSSPTPPGRFTLTWRSVGRASSVNPAWYLRWYFNFEPHRGLAFHQYVLPGRPASHGCIRLLEVDARWLFAWGLPSVAATEASDAPPVGTVVLIVGTYDFDGQPPWLDATWLRGSAALPGRLPIGDESKGAPQEAWRAGSLLY